MPGCPVLQSAVDLCICMRTGRQKRTCISYGRCDKREGPTPTGKLVRFGYVNITADKEADWLLPGETIRGHEFHYWDSTRCGYGLYGGKAGREEKVELYSYERNTCLPVILICICRPYRNSPVGSSGVVREWERTLVQ